LQILRNTGPGRQAWLQNRVDGRAGKEFNSRRARTP
jgi:hypothetical protein